MTAEEIDDTFIHGVMYDCELRVVPAAVLSRHRVAPHLLRTRVRSELDDQRRTTCYIQEYPKCPEIRSADWTTAERERREKRLTV